jgi:hypothetical protein
VPDLQPPPEFGSRGADPPFRSESTLIKQHFFTAPATSTESGVLAILAGSYPDVLAAVDEDPDVVAQLDAVRASLSSQVPENPASFDFQLRRIYTGGDGRLAAVLAWVFSLYFGLGLFVTVPVALVRARRASAEEPPLAKQKEALEIRRLRVTRYWEREAHIEQLAPGTSLTNTTRFRLGITKAQTRDLRANLGVDLPELGVRVANSHITEESRETEKTITLSNDRTGFYRRIALWRLVDAVCVETLIFSDELKWVRRSALEYHSSSSIATSFVDIPVL